MSAVTLVHTVSATPVLTCRDCWDGFAWDSSPDLDRCPRCAEAHAWHEGATSTTTTADEATRLSAGRDPKEV